MSNGNLPTEDLRIRRGRVNSVDLFEVKENELDTLEQGEQSDIFLNFAIFLISLAFSVLLTLLSANFKKEIYQTLALIIMVVGFLLGILLLLLWRRNRVGIKKIVKRIRSRIPPENVIVEKDAVTLETITRKTDTLPNN